MKGEAMTYRDAVMSNLASTMDELSTRKSFSWNSRSKIFLHVGYIEKALALLKRDREKIDSLSADLDNLRERSKSVRPKSGVYLCFCGGCGHKMQKTDTFCSHCGRRIDWT